MKAVGFIGEFQPEGEATGNISDSLATGFFVSVPSSIDGHYLYFVTARHVTQDLIEKEVCITVNKRECVGGGIMEICPIRPLTWFLHPTDVSCDVAVTQVSEIGDADIVPVPIEELLTADDVSKCDIGVGDEIFATGLFSEVRNSTRNIPILRHGNIAMMPGEQIQTKFGYADVCLVEARSIGGLSGSPAFVRPTANIPLRDTRISGFLALANQVKLLGVVYGHWDVKESEINNPKVNQDRKHGVNYGIAIVTPAIKIVETINRLELRDIRMKTDEALQGRNIPEPDSLRPTEKPFTRDDFETALKKASRKIALRKS